jgi:hypothetical protein
LFIVNPEVFISLGEGKRIDFGTSTKDLKESQKNRPAIDIEYEIDQVT